MPSGSTSCSPAPCPRPRPHDLARAPRPRPLPRLPRSAVSRCTLPETLPGAAPDGLRDSLDLWCRNCDAQYPQPSRRLPGPAAADGVRRADEVSRRGAAPGRAARVGVAAAAAVGRAAAPAAPLPAVRARRSRDRSRLRQRTLDPVERGERRRLHRRRRQPVLRARSARHRGSGARRSAPAAVRRRRLHQGLRARRPRAPVARGAGRDARRGRPRPRARRRAVRLLARPQERADRQGPARDQRARPRPRADRPDRHDAGAPAQVGSPEPAAGRAAPRGGRRSGRPAHRADPLLHADRRRLRREHPDADGRARPRPPRRPQARRVDARGAGVRRGAGSGGRPARGAAQRQGPARPRRAARPRAAGRHGAHGHRPPAVRPDPLRPVLRPARRNADAVRILYAAIDQVVPGTLGGSTHVQAVAEGLAALGHEVHVAVRAGTPIVVLPIVVRSLSRRRLQELRRGTTSARRSDRRTCGCCGVDACARSPRRCARTS